MTLEKKLKILKNLSWDLDIEPYQLNRLTTGAVDEVNGFTREALFLRSLERVRWVNLLELWGKQTCCKLYTEKVAKGLRNADLRQKYDKAFSLLRGKPLPPSEWGSEYCERIRHTFLSYRWNRP